MSWVGLPLPDDAPPIGACVGVERPEPGLVELTLHPPHRERTVLDGPLWRDLEVALESVNPDAGDRGLVIRGREPLHFAYGADLDSIELANDQEIVRRVVRAVHLVLARLEQLGKRMHTVAAVGGPVPGGALELSLACNTIVAADDPSTRIGLPETKLGIVPGWGGCHRLPRRIGVPAALTAILTGRLYDVRRAMKLGIIDRKTPTEYLERVSRDLAMGRLARPKPRRRIARWLVDRNPVVTTLIERKARRETAKKTRGKYPAIDAALPLVVQGPRTSLRDAAEKEAAAIARLATGPVCKNLVALFLGSEATKKLVEDDAGGRAVSPSRGVVVGAGVMGGAIASLLAEKGVSTRLADLSPEALDEALVGHLSVIARKRKRRRLQAHEARAAIDRLDATERLIGIGRAEVAIEAVAERLEVKRAVMNEVAKALPPNALLATNTSSLSVTAIAAELPNPERVVGLHFFNPVRQMPLVEVVPGELTSQESVRRACALALKLGKTPVVVKDVSGFLVNRVLGPYLDESIRLLAGGVAPGRLEELMLEFGMPMGPLRLLDEVGLDIIEHAARSLYGAYGERMRPTEAIVGYLEVGRLGRKAGQGFYHWANPRNPHLSPDLSEVQTSADLEDLGDDDIIDRCVLAMANEAVRCLGEGVVSSPAELDLAMVFGTGFAPFRGGVLRHLEAVGLQRVIERLAELRQMPDVEARGAPAERFEACPALVEAASAGGFAQVAGKRELEV
jgi:3-hydroxyacyl-CoA dehydrogenase/enoyl-CoA hydratase/3-hydroxybutyryl-CoA epimerase